MSAPKISYQANGLSEDSSAVAADQTHAAIPVASAELLARLQAFAAVPAVDLLDVKATVVLQVEGGGEFTVRNEAGQLFMIESPASENTPLMRSPEEIVQFLDDEFSPEEVEEIEEVVVETSKARTVLNSPILLIALVVVFGVLAYSTFKPEAPEGVSFVDDSARQLSFSQQFEGRYGAVVEDGDLLYVIEGDRFKIFEVLEDGLESEPFVDETYTIGQRDGAAVIVLENGAIMGHNSSGGLVFEDEVYPRLP
ncbi:MAG: hypothetical protein HOH58_16150 [Opitutaceae bacterium]|jgi:hypothetical protein|nr:hypothetical protein [Opitutaceae bacterium]